MRVLAQVAFKTKNQNPYNWLLNTHLTQLGVEVAEFSRLRALFGNYDLWHLHWTHVLLYHPSAIRAFLNVLQLAIALNLARLRGIKIVWSVHDLQAYSSRHPQLEAWYWKTLIPKVDGYISLSQTGKQMALEKFPLLHKKPGFVVPHGHYREVYPNRVTLAEARQTLNIEPKALVVAFVGQVRPYKNLPYLIETFRGLTDPQAVLLVAGWADRRESEQEIVRYAARDDSRIKLFLGAIPEETMQFYLNAADLVVLPYRNILHSGASFLALSFNKPVLLPDSGSLPELQALVGTEWVSLYTGELTTDKLASALDWALHAPRPEKAPLKALEWEAIAQKTLEAFHTIVSEKNR